MQATLDTARLQLRPVNDGDIDPLWTLWTDPKVRLFLWDNVVIRRDQAEKTVRDSIAVADRGLGMWIITERGGSSLTGCAGLVPADSVARYYPPAAGAVEILIALAPEFWYRGYASEAVSTLIDHARRTLRITRLIAANDVPNTASDRMLRRVGFVACAETAGPRYPMRHYNLPADGRPSAT